MAYNRRRFYDEKTIVEFAPIADDGDWGGRTSNRDDWRRYD